MNSDYYEIQINNGVEVQC